MPQSDFWRKLAAAAQPIASGLLHRGKAMADREKKSSPRAASGRDMLNAG